MRRSAVAVLTLVAAVLVFAACSERESTSPRLPSGASFSQTLTPATSCDFTQIDKARRAYFTSSQDPVIGLINQMQGAPAGATRNPIAWQILRVVAGERLTSATTAAANGAVFVNDVLRCTTYSFPTTPASATDIQQEFVDNLSLVLSAGVFNVRGGNGDPTDPAAALDGSPRVLAQPQWGVEPHPAWPTGGPFLVYGYPVLIANVVLNPATNINTNGTGGPYNGFELGTIPDNTPKNGNNMLVGICYQSTTGGTIANRLIHSNSEILVNNTPVALCGMTAASVSSLGAPSWYARALAGAASVFVPRTAWAMDGELDIGGLPSSWSPFASGALLGSNIAPTITVQPNDAVVGGNVHVVVNVTIDGLPVPGVDLTVAIDNNQGVPAGAIITSGDPSTHATTDPLGNATFNITVGKPGGYLVSVGGNLTGVTTGGTQSAQFHIKNQ